MSYNIENLTLESIGDDTYIYFDKSKTKYIKYNKTTNLIELSNNMYSGSYIRADGGVFVNGTTFGIDTSGNINSNGGIQNNDGTSELNRTGNVVLKINRKTDDGILIQWLRDGSGVGNISVASGTVSYNASVQGHSFQCTDEQVRNKFASNLKIGHVLVNTGIFGKNKNGKETKHQYLSFTNIAKDKKRAGVYFGVDYSKPRGYADNTNGRLMRTYAGSGLFWIRVTDTNGDIELGDFLETSKREGEAQKQIDENKKNYTIAQAQKNVEWENEEIDIVLGYKWKLIQAKILCG